MEHEPCLQCITNTKNPQYPKPCIKCDKYCFCEDDLVCKFCIKIMHFIIINNINNKNYNKKLLTQYPCYCIDGKTPQYFLKCDDCTQKYCKCINHRQNYNYSKQNIYCPFCFELEYNKMIKVFEKN